MTHPIRSTMPAILAVGAALVLAGPALSGDKGGKHGEHEGKGMAEMAAAAKVPIDQAIKTATDKVPGKVVEAELEKKHDKIVWEVEVVGADGKIAEVHIDADSGAVIDVEDKKPEMKKERKGKKD